MLIVTYVNIVLVLNIERLTLVRQHPVKKLMHLAKQAKIWPQIRFFAIFSCLVH